MSKLVLFFSLLLTLTTSAQETATLKVQSSSSQQWDEQEPYVNGFARVLQHNQFSYINKAGQLISPVQFDGARNFVNHLAAVQQNNKWGFIDEKGKIVVPLKYDIAYDFNEALTAVYINYRWWLINTNGAVVKALDINAFYGFKNGVAKVEKNGRTGIMNAQGVITFTGTAAIAPQTKQIPYHPNNTQSANSITVCPDNIDFEFGNFTNWNCYTGHVDSIGTTNVITLTPSPPTPNRHTLYSRVLPSPIDPFGLFPINPPDGSNFALKLGNTQIGAEAEGVKYTIHVPANDSNFSIKYDYAVVFQNPNHTPWAQPRFQVKVFDSAANQYVDCASFEYVSTANLPGFAVSTVDTSVIYKPWSTVFLSLRGYAGKTMILEFTNADCVRRGHWGYGYIDVEKPCGQSVEMQYECDSPHVTTLTAPPGFQIYNWWDSAFANLLGTGQQVILNPGPSVNTTIWLEMIPFNNFGCLDTIPVRITGEFTADFGMSDTLGLCAPHTFTFYNHNLPSISTIWDFGDGTTATGDTVTHTYALPGSYLVKMNVIMQGGCVGNTIKVVSVVQPAGNFSFTGGSYCGSQTVQFNASVSNADSLFWNFGDGTTLNTKSTTVSHTYTTAGIFIPSLIIKALGGCETPIPATDTIKIEVLNAGYKNTQVKICGSTTLNFTDTSTAYFGISSRDWNFGDGATGSGANVSHTYTTSGTYNVRLIVTGVTGCKDTVIKPFTVTVNSIPVAAFTGNITDCQNVPVTFTSNVTSVDPISSYAWTSTSGASASTTNFTVTFPVAGTYTIRLIVTTVNGCKDTATQSITINPTPNVVQPPSQVLCNGDFAAATIFNGTVPGTVYSWTNTAPVIGLAASGTGDIASFQASANGNSLATATITVRPSANGCLGTPKSFTITVHPTPNVAQPADQTLCDNSNTAPITFSGTIAGTAYTWTNNNTSIGLAASGSGNIPAFTASSNGTAVNTATITVTPTLNGCPGPSKTFVITVKPTPGVLQPADQLLCSGSTTAAINFTGPVPGTVYNWTNTAPVIGLAANGTGNIAPFTATANGNSIATATITVTPSLNGCTANPKSFTITVNPVPAVAQPTDQSLCDNSTTAPVNFSGAVSGATYNWTNNNPSIGLAISGTGNIPAFTASSNGNTINTAIITVIPTFNGCTGTPKTFTITVNPMPGVVQPADQALCAGNFTSAVNFTGLVSGTVYNWTNNNTVIGLAASGTGNIASFQANSNANTTATAMITVTPSLNGCTAAPKSFTITVNPTPDVAQPTDQTLCDNSTTAPINFSGAVTNTIYNWTNSNTTIGLAASGTGNIPAFTASSNGNTTNTATITVTPTINGCTGTPKTFTITVKPMPDVVQPADQSLCAGSFTAPVNFSGPVAGTIYSWSNNAPVIGLAASGTGNIPSFQAAANGNSPATATITVTASANGCTAVPKSFTIAVNPTPDVAQPTDQTLCDNSNTAPINFTGTIPGATYNWTNSNPSIGLAASGTGNIPSFAASSNGSVVNTATITVTPVIGSCSGTPKIFTITVNPVPDMVQPADQKICDHTFTNAVNFSGSVAGTVYTWTNTAPTIGLAASGTGNIPAFQALGNGAISVATITVKATANGCNGPVKSFTYTINPVPAVNQPVSQAVCDGAVINTTSFSGNVPGADYNWVNSNTAIGLAASGTGNIPSFTAINHTQTDISATITVMPSTANCSGAPKLFTLAIHPAPAVVAQNDAKICLGNTKQLNATGAATYSWTPIDHLSCNTCANPVAQPVDTIVYKVKGTSSFGCIAFDSVVLNVVKPFRMRVAPGDTLCIGEQTQLAAFDAQSYVWTPTVSVTGANTATPTVKPSVTTKYRVVGFDGQNCFTDTAYVLVTVGPRPTVNLGSDRTLATGTPINLTAVTTNGPIIKWMWTPAQELSCSNCPAPSTVVKNNSVYTVQVTNAWGCVASDTLIINPICKSSQVYIPNAFTPDGDGLNDIMMVRGSGITVKSFRIFNRWGELVFEKENFQPNDPKFGWDGKVRGVPATPDVFVYTAEIFCDNGIPYTYKGNVTLLK
ncbi:MAG: PKD domain-containing protein [Bacteroidetes bacterium]|nr:PKD domain-containing protein [Bacteroidota bacterium]